MLPYKRIFTWLFAISVLFVAIPASAAEKEAGFTIVIDAGHGGKDIGATDNGVREKDINLGVAKQLSAMLKKKMKNVKVVMTRDDDTFISLQERANIANRNKGNLFISIHTNSVDAKNPNRKSVSGASVYALGLHKDQSNLQVAQRENSVIELESDYKQKYSGFDPSKDESYIIFEMAQKKNLGNSLKFANLAQKQLVGHSNRNDRGVKQAGFWVLWATSMPAVLVELDFICNPESAKFMGSEAGQKKLAEALYNAIEKYMGNTRKNSAQITHKESPSSQLSQTTTESDNGTALTGRVNAPVRKERTDTPPAQVAAPGRATARRRRSNSSKELSEKRDVETSSIPLHTEKDYLAVVDNVAPEQPIQVEEIEESTGKKGKKDKSTKGKNSSRNKSKSGAGNYADTKILVSNNGTVTRQSRQSTSNHHSKTAKMETIYKIQVLASADQLTQSDNRFGGLKPIKAFKENNLYKYTYGESSDKKEIEKLLKEVHKIIPDAFIISRKR